jgi:hypothetical protein
VVRPDCEGHPYCVLVTAGTSEPGLHVDKDVCGGATLSGPFDVVRGQLNQLRVVRSLSPARRPSPGR